MDEFQDGPVDGVKMRAEDSQEDPVKRMTVPEAAEVLGVTQSAVRKRIQRGTLPWDKDAEGRIYVYVDSSDTSLRTEGVKSRDALPGQSRDELLEAYRDQVEFLRRELERKDAILMSWMQRMPELEATPESRGGSPVSSEGIGKREDTEKRRSWLYRFFFGP